MQIGGAHEFVMGGGMVFGVVVAQILAARPLIDEELALAGAILDPIKLHVDGFRPFLFDCVVL